MGKIFLFFTKIIVDFKVLLKLQYNQKSGGFKQKRKGANK